MSAPIWVLTCYDQHVAEYAILDEGKVAGDEHIRACPLGAMPWATNIEWHYADQLGSYCAAAGGEWLNHHLDPSRSEDLVLQIIPKCECPDLDITSTADLRDGIHRFVKGWGADCPIHGYEGTEPTYRKVIGFEDGGS